MHFSLCHSPVSEEEVNETRILVSNKLLHEKFLLGGKTPKPPNLSPQLSLKKNPIKDVSHAQSQWKDWQDHPCLLFLAAPESCSWITQPWIFFALSCCVTNVWIISPVCHLKTSDEVWSTFKLSATTHLIWGSFLRCGWLQTSSGKHRVRALELEVQVLALTSDTQMTSRSCFNLSEPPGVH